MSRDVPRLDAAPRLAWVSCFFRCLHRTCLRSVGSRRFEPYCRRYLFCIDPASRTLARQPEKTARREALGGPISAKLKGCRSRGSGTEARQHWGFGRKKTPTENGWGWGVGGAVRTSVRTRSPCWIATDGAIVRRFGLFSTRFVVHARRLVLRPDRSRAPISFSPASP